MGSLNLAVLKWRRLELLVGFPREKRGVVCLSGSERTRKGFRPTPGSRSQKVCPKHREKLSAYISSDFTPWLLSALAGVDSPRKTLQGSTPGKSLARNEGPRAPLGGVFRQPNRRGSAPLGLGLGLERPLQRPTWSICLEVVRGGSSPQQERVRTFG